MKENLCKALLVSAKKVTSSTMLCEELQAQKLKK